MRFLIFLLFLIPVTSYGALTDGLQSYWKFDETSGIRSDSHGSNDLTDNNTVGFTTGLWGNAADFVSANSEYLSKTDNASLKPTNPSVSVWFRPDSISNSAIVDKGNLGGDYAIFIESGSIKVRVRTNSTDRTITLGSASTATTYHVVLVFDNTNDTLYGYLDGNLAGSTAATGTYNTSTNGLSIGSISAASSNFFDGWIDEVGFWNRVLTTDEVSDLYNSGFGLEYPFTEAATTTFGEAQSVDQLNNTLIMLFSLISIFIAFIITMDIWSKIRQ